ncbi:hypothetical protein [Algirhabdus cladophorae]|uniref:hypothetical protein n=1 Tax=Algirhabdus cladophorae TaxID=3377108 RepID=UPI003B847B96
MQTTLKETALILSYLSVRTFLGLLGFVLPVALILYSLIFGTGQLETSISEYYYTPMGDVFVGTLWAMGAFLISYNGYARSDMQKNSGRFRDLLTDRLISTIAGISVICVALFPVNPSMIEDQIATGFTFHSNAVHYTAAGIYFTSMAIFALVLFTRGDGTEENFFEKNGRKITRIKWTPRNRYFVWCGGAILAAMLALMGYFALASLGLSGATDTLDRWNFFLWAEVAAVVAFSAAWLEKGRALISPLNIARKLSD